RRPSRSAPRGRGRRPRRWSRTPCAGAWSGWRGRCLSSCPAACGRPAAASSATGPTWRCHGGGGWLLRTPGGAGPSSSARGTTSATVGVPVQHVVTATGARGRAVAVLLAVGSAALLGTDAALIGPGGTVPAPLDYALILAG